ncbi:MAG: CHAT domain-containing protein, partial [Anaerolineae bacterium]|nr:CHAT domain-containing protein [Anaerolineae bacterium]
METFVLRVDRLDAAEGHYPVSLAAVEGGEGPAEATIPASLALPQMEEPFTAEEMRQRFLAAQAADEALLQIGQQLYALIHQGEVRARLATLPPQRRLLLDIRAPELEALPWELMADERRGRLFAEFVAPVCRGELRRAAAEGAGEWPLRMLVVIGSRPDDSDVEAGLEVERLFAALQPVSADVDLILLKQRSRGDLLRAMERYQPHILHYIGHGVVPDEGEGEPFLTLYDAGSGIEDEWTAEQIRNELILAQVPSFVFVNACRSEEPGHPGLWSIADAFLALNVPAVLAMQTDIDGRDAARFAGAVYEGLAGKGLPAPLALDAAVNRARQKVFAVDAGLKRRDWAAPCLRVQAPPDKILRFDGGIERARRLRVMASPALENVPLYVDRCEERFKVWHRLSAAEEAQVVGLAGDAASVVCVVGEAKIGKTALAQLLMERCALTRHQVRYVRIPEGAHYLTVLRLIRDARPIGQSAGAAPGQDAFAAFNREVNSGLGAAIAAGSSKDIDQGAEPTIELGQEAVAEPLFQAFRA